MPSNALVGELLALGTAFSWSIGIFPFTEAARRMGASPVNHYRLLLALILITLLGFVIFGLSPAKLFLLPKRSNWLWLGASGIVGLSLGDYFSFTSFAILGPRLGSIFASLSPGGALLMGMILLGERINLVGILGIILTISGVAWLSMGRNGKDAPIHSKHGSLKKGIVYGVLSAFCQGAGLVLAKKGMHVEPGETALLPLHATWIRLIVATTYIFLFSMVLGRLREISRPVFKNQDKGIVYMGLGTFFGPVLGVTLSMATVSYIDASVAQTIFSLVPVIVLPLAYVFYKERITRISLFGALIAVSGVLILIWRETITSLIQ